MSYGGHISDRALWDKKWYPSLFRNPNGNKYTITFYDGNDIVGRSYGLLFGPQFNPESTMLCTGDNRQRNFFTKQERYEFYASMMEVMNRSGCDCDVRFLDRKDGLRDLVDSDKE